MDENVFGAAAASLGRCGSRKVRPGTRVKVFEFGKLKLILIEGRILDLPNGIVLLAVEFDQQFEFLLVEQTFSTRERVALGSEDVTALVGDDVGVISACGDRGRAEIKYWLMVLLKRSIIS